MKAAVLEAVRKIKVQNIAAPQPRPDEVVINVRTCGNVRHRPQTIHWRVHGASPSGARPRVFGRDCGGGKEVRNLKVGQRVVSDPNESCGKCYWCRTRQPCFCKDLTAYGVLRDSGFADYCTASEKGVYPIPEGVDDETAAFAEPVSCVVHAVDRAAYRPGETVVIIGGGPIGQIHLQFAVNSGARKVILITSGEARRALAMRFGAHAVINPKDGNVKEKILAETDGLGPDVVMEAVGHIDTIEQAVDLARRGGRVVIFGFAPEGRKATFIPFNLLCRELTILGSWVNPYSYSRALEVLASGRIQVKPLISNRLKLDDISNAYTLLQERPAGFMKSLVSP